MSNASQASVLVSIVVPCLDEEEVFPLLQSALLSVAKRMEPAVAVEFVLVDDGSQDATWSLICAFARGDARVRGVSLSRNFGQQMAITCGYDVARGDAVVSMDADLQDPPELVPQLVEVWQTGADVVYAVRSRRRGEGLFKRASAAFFYRLLRWIGASTIREASGDFRLLSRRALDALVSLQHNDGHWCGELQGDSILESEYLLMKFILGQEREPMVDGRDGPEVLARIANELRAQQRERVFRDALLDLVSQGGSEALTDPEAANRRGVGPGFAVFEAFGLALMDERGVDAIVGELGRVSADRPRFRNEITHGLYDLSLRLLRGGTAQAVAHRAGKPRPAPGSTLRVSAPMPRMSRSSMRNRAASSEQPGKCMRPSSPRVR